MTPEIWTTIGVGAALLAVIVPTLLHLSGRIDEQGKEMREQGQVLSKRIGEQGKEINARIDEQGKEINARIDEQGKEQAQFREDMAGRMGKLEGLLEGLREAITGKRAA